MKGNDMAVFDTQDDEAYRRRKLTQSYWAADRSRPLRDWTLGDLLADAVMNIPDKVALIAGRYDAACRKCWTYT